MSVWNRLDAVGPTTPTVVGVTLLVISEPATSAFGAGLMLLGTRGESRGGRTDDER
ncbi:hypothetical protein RYH80_12125 [Halobaculum sp. MBLA0147]|uniref:hypothetical protein n=1 Tax=Halobaculum sp. MBLA0147 TaxID=3079934 RepID=UPI003523A912